MWTVCYASCVASIPDRAAANSDGWRPVVLLGALALFALAARELRRARTPIRAERPSTSLVSGGPYRRSRNPIYLALAGAQIGLGLALGSPWIVGLTPLAMAFMTRVVIRREERYLGSRVAVVKLDFKVPAKVIREAARRSR